MASTSQVYRLRPGRFADIAAAARLGDICFRDDHLFAILFPNRLEHLEEFKVHIRRLYETRYWTLGYVLTLAVDEDDRVVGCSWWRRPDDEFSVFYTWLSPSSWFAAFMRTLLSLRDTLFPLRNIDKSNAGIYQRVFDTIKPDVLNTPRRKQAWYLSTLAVDPSLQGKGIGTMLVRDGQHKAAQRGKATWLVGLYGTDNLYTRFGFAEVARANVGELSHWNGGIIMFTE